MCLLAICMGFLVAQWLKKKKKLCLQCRSLPAKQETWVQSVGQEDHLEKEMATYFSILAWEILWTEEPGRLQSMGSQRIRHDLATKQQQLETDDFTSFVLILKSFIGI